jgi:LuxR family maltose regulon positive regulatory protein
MTSPLVTTKLFIPRARRGLVDRPRLRERLSRVTESRLTLISAPAGFGKTTLLSAWLAAAGTDRVAWLSLEESDRPPASFWTYVITALRTVVPGIGAALLPLPSSAQAPIETVVAALVNELAAVPDDVVLVLDDYHLVDGGELSASMTFLLEHLPERVHLVISTRADPALPLARLRARGELVEIRAADLRFTVDETAAYLTDASGLELPVADVATLAGRTEGWIAALQLAVLSMRGRADVGGFIAGFAGDDRYIVDYLVEEVLRGQPERVRGFLTRTSVLDRLSGPLCDEVTGEPGGKAMLEALERANLFVVPLDDSRHWYRYHHLFGDVLHTHLLDDRPGEVPDLHRRASDWYDRHDEPVPAVLHALAAGDVERAAALVELAIPGLSRDRQEATIRRWVDDLPADVVRNRPVLAIRLVGGLMASGEFATVEDRLRDAERAMAGPAVVADESELPRLPGAIAMYRAGLALISGDLAATRRHALAAIDHAAEGDDLVRSAASALSGLAYWAGGDLDAAYRAYSVSVDGLRRAGHIADVLGCSITLGDISITRGRLREAARTFEQALRLASGESGTVLRGAADMRVGLSQIAYERGDLAAATEHLRLSRELGEHLGLPQNPYRWRVAMARVRAAEGDPDAALDLLDEAERVYTGDFSPNVRPIAATRARLLAASGRVDEAVQWARDRGLAADDELSYSREYEHITLARVLLAESAVRAADHLLDRLLAAAEAGDRTGSVIEILVLQALARHANGDTAAARTALDRALTLAEPEGYVRVFADAGPPITDLLRSAAKRPYVRRLLAARAPVPGTSARRLVDPLSERELDVLRLLATDLDGPDIARRLHISLNTLRTHTKNIYAKLGVNSRRAAVRQAGDLDLR